MTPTQQAALRKLADEMSAISRTCVNRSNSERDDVGHADAVGAARAYQVCAGKLRALAVSHDPLEVPEAVMGLTKREHFAGLALGGLVAKHGVVLPLVSGNTGNHPEEAAFQACRYADALIAKLETRS